MTREEFEALLEEAYNLGMEDKADEIEILKEDVFEDPYVRGYCLALLEAGVYDESVLDDAKNFVKEKAVRIQKRTAKEVEEFKKTEIYKKCAKMVDMVGKKLPNLHPKFKRFLLTIAKYQVEGKIVSTIYLFFMNKLIPGVVTALKAGDVVGYMGAMASMTGKTAAIAFAGTVVTGLIGLILAGATIVTIVKYIKNHESFTVPKKEDKKEAKQESVDIFAEGSEDLLLEACGITEEFITETEQNINKWLDSYNEEAISPKDVAMKIYERVINSAHVVKAFAKDPKKAEKAKKYIKTLAITAANFLKKNKFTVIKGALLGWIVSVIVSIVVISLGAITGGVVTLVGGAQAGIGLLGFLTTHAAIFTAALKLLIDGSGVVAAIKYIKSHADMSKPKVKQESAEEPAITFSLESEYDKYVTA